MANSNGTIYFGYGSNLWREQMETRCPNSTYLGVARLNDYKWLINERGYANVVQLSSHDNSSFAPSSESESEDTVAHAYENEVWGLVYTLQPSDEKRLDRNEGVPIAYTKEMLEYDFWPVDDNDRSSRPADVTEKPEHVEMLVYINRHAVKPSEPKLEYIHRMNMGIKDALKEGVPKGYVEKVMRKFIPDNEDEYQDEEVVEVAKRQATEFEDEK